MDPSIGQTFRTAREQKKVTASVAAKGTRIKIQVIEAMENDDFSVIAAPAYAKGFIRIYAEYLGLDPEPLVAEYVRLHAPPQRASLLGEDEEPSSAASEEPARKSFAMPKIRMPRLNWKAIPWPTVTWSSALIRKVILWSLAIVVFITFFMLVTHCIRRPGKAEPLPLSEHLSIDTPLLSDAPETTPSQPLPVIEDVPEPYLEHKP